MHIKSEYLRVIDCKITNNLELFDIALKYLIYANHITTFNFMSYNGKFFYIKYISVLYLIFKKLYHDRFINQKCNARISTRKREVLICSRKIFE